MRVYLSLAIPSYDKYLPNIPYFLGISGSITPNINRCQWDPSWSPTEGTENLLQFTCWGPSHYINTLRLRQHGRHLADDTFKRISLNENVIISIKISLKFVPMGPINNIPALVQIMAWRRPGHKPLSKAMMVSLLTHICVTRPQWVNSCEVGFILRKMKIYLHFYNFFSTIMA